MNKLRALIICVAVLVGGAAASARNVNTLVINRTDGKTDKIALHKDLNITQSENGDILMVHPNITVTYPCELVKTLTGGFQTFATGNYYIGDHELKPDAIEAPEVEGLTINIETDAIRIAGLGESSVRLIDLQGKTIVSVAVQGGEAVVSTASIPAGVYLLAAGKTTLKVKL